MTSRPRPSAQTRATFNVQSPVFVAESRIATVWKVQRADGSPAALKCYFDNTMQDEAPGFAWLRAMNGHAAAKVYALDDTTALLEWLDGPSLGDISRSGYDAEANQRLIETACRLHAKPIKVTADMPLLSDRFDALRTAKPLATATEQTNHTIARAQALAAQLLTNQHDIRPLHGDLHHDNIMASARGDLAFDAKGIVGDRGYELANAFLNPLGAEATVRDKTRITYLMRSWGQAFDIEPSILLDWACVHAALATIWHITDGGKPDIATLHLLWTIRDGLK